MTSEENNKEHNREYNKEYYKKYREKMSSYYSQKVECICGKTVSKGAYNRHRKSKLHFNTLDHKIENEKIKQKLNISNI